MDDGTLKEILERQQRIFVSNIAYELEKSHSRRFESFGFPVFGAISNDYYEQVYFQSYLESYTRKFINGVLKEVLDDVCADFTWPEFDCAGIYNGYTNIEYEKQFGFEFIDNANKIGYRYYHIDPDKTNSIKEKWNVKSINIVLWQSEDMFDSFAYDDNSIKVISIVEMFKELLFDIAEEEVKRNYNMFIRYVYAGVRKANEMISLVTIPGFTSSYVHKTREKMIGYLRKEIACITKFNVKCKEYRSNEDSSRELIEKYKLPHQFLDGQLEWALVGARPYAKSFMTSEYLYWHFKGNPLFDYTPIVSGYIKSIEQLLDSICTSYRNYRHIQIKEKNMKSYTLGDYIDFLNKHEDILQEKVRSSKDIIINCINSYRAESRNRLFHKDFLNDWERVDFIRENTIFLYVVLLGATDPVLKNQKVLGILNMEYDRLFEILDSQNPSSTYSLLIGENEYSNMRKNPRCEGLEYDKYALINNSLTFSKYDGNKEIVVELSTQSMPSEIWITNTQGEKIKKLWPAPKV